MQFSNHSRRQDRLHWLAEMYRAYAADLQRFISNKVGDPTVAEDLTSTVFLKALRRLREDQSAQIVRGAGSTRRLVPPSSITGRRRVCRAARCSICSFCGRCGEEVTRLFTAEVGIAERSTPSPSIFICNHCVKRFFTILGTA